MLTPVVLDPELIDEIATIGRDRHPSEACGILIPTPHKGQKVWEMPNRSLAPHDSFELHGDDIMITLDGWPDGRDPSVWDSVAIWHTHPRGNVGPSRADLEHRLERVGNLVVAICDDGAARATWY